MIVWNDIPTVNVIPHAVDKDENLDFKKLGQGIGLVHFTIENVGNVPARLMGVRDLAPGERFVAEGPFPYSNSNFQITFHDDGIASPQPKLVVWCAIPVCD